jgi:hypothetical protein
MQLLPCGRRRRFSRPHTRSRFRRPRPESSGRPAGKPRTSWRESCSALIPAAVNKIGQSGGVVKASGTQKSPNHEVFLAAVVSAGLNSRIGTHDFAGSGGGGFSRLSAGRAGAARHLAPGRLHDPDALARSDRTYSWKTDFGPDPGGLWSVEVRTSDDRLVGRIWLRVIV